MTKRKRIPAPFERILPSIIRTRGPRLVFVGVGAAALLVFFAGGSYVLSHISTPPKASTSQASVTKMTEQAPPDAQVLGTATTNSAAGNQPAATQKSTEAQAGSPRSQQVLQSSPANVTPTANTTTSHAVYSKNQSAGNHSEPGSSSSTKTTASVDVHADTPLGSLSLNLPL